MKCAFTFGRKHGGKSLELVTGADVPVHQQLAEFKEFQRVRSHEKFEEVFLFIASPAKSHRLDTPEKAAAAAAKAKADAEAKAKADAQPKEPKKSKPSTKEPK
jgi:hypothetical protein